MYFEVECKCGHVGKGQFVPIFFPVRAPSAKAAAAVARWIPRVKHHHKDAILSVESITEEAFHSLQMRNNEDLYLKCKCIQDQRGIDLQDRICEERSTSIKRKNHDVSAKMVNGTLVRNPIKYRKMHPII